MEGPVARLILQRPETRNAFSLADWSKLYEAAQRLGQSSARVVVLESAVAGQFCAGADIKAMAGMRADLALASRFRTDMRAAFAAIAQLPMPTIANIQGNCFGAGVALSLACDMRIAGRAARFAITPAKLGIIYPYEDIARLRALVGFGQASRLLFSATTIDAEEAARIGLVELLGDRQDVASLAEDIARNAPSSVSALKSLVQDPANSPAHAALFDSFFSKAAFAEGFSAFTQKRAPQFPDRD